MFWLLTWGRCSNCWKSSLYLFNAPYHVHCLWSKFTPGIPTSLLTNLSFTMAYWWLVELTTDGFSHLIWNLDGRQGALWLTVLGLLADSIELCTYTCNYNTHIQVVGTEYWAIWIKVERTFGSHIGYTVWWPSCIITVCP